MNIAGLQPQIFCSIIVILAAAGLAVLVDCLKRKNEKLGEALVELTVRREQERQQVIQSRLNAAANVTERTVVRKTRLEAPAPKVVAKPEPPVEAPAPQVSERNIEEMSNKAEAMNSKSEETRKAQDRATEFASLQGRRRHPGPSPEVLPRPENGTPKEALHEWLNQRAAARTTPSPTPHHAPRPVAVETKPAPAQPQPAFGSSRPEVFIDESLWESILGRTSGDDQAPKPKARFEVIVGSAGIPAGMHEQFTLNRLLESNKPFTGLVISLSVNQNEGRAISKDIVLSVNHFVSGMLRGEDFACQTGDDEFLILCPGERGGDAQRRLTEVAEGLWDFQLRGLGTFSILFSWGDAQVQDELLSEAMASASERMHQTRRTRKTVSLDSPSPRRRAIAAV